MITLELTGGALNVRSVLFAPATRPELVAKAIAGEADAVIVDLEDSVAPTAKETARELMARAVADAGRHHHRVFVRINAMQSPEAPADLEVLQRLRPAALVIPRIDAEALRRLPVWSTDIIGVVETARGVCDIGIVASDHRVRGLILGLIDLAVDLDVQIDINDGTIIHAARHIALTARAHGHTALIDAPCPDYRDLDGIAASTREATSRGYWAKACIHPAQVGVVNRVLTPTAAEVELARTVIVAYEAAVEAGYGAVGAQGRMIDAPVAALARQVLRRAETLARGSAES